MLLRPVLRIRFNRSQKQAQRMARRDGSLVSNMDLAHRGKEGEGSGEEETAGLTRINTSTTGQPSHAAKSSDWLVDFVEALGATGLFGGSITFSVLIVDLAAVSANSRIDIETVRLLVSIAWGCFTFQLGIAVLIRVLYHDDLLQQLKDKGTGTRTLRFLNWLLSVAVVALSSLALFSFVFLGVAVSAYVGWPGWTVAGGAFFLWLVMIVMCIYEFVGKKANRLFFDL